MARGFRSSRGGLPAPQRQISNDGFGGTGLITMGASLTGTQAGSIGSIVNVPAATLVRTRGIFGITVTISGSNNNVITGAFGMMKVSREAFVDVGLTALSTPLDDVERAWIVWEPWSVYADGTAVGAGDQGGYHRFKIDSRGMRKLKLDDTLAIVVEARQNDATTGTLIEFTYDIRQQFKL